MVHVVTRAPNITNISCWKIAPKPLAYIDPRILLNYYTFILGNKIWNWVERYFSNSGIFPNFSCLFHQSVPHCLRFYHCFSASPIIFKKCYFTQKQRISHTKKKISGKVQIPKWAPFAPNGTANEIAGKSWNHRGQYWTLNPMARKPWISHPSVG